MFHARLSRRTRLGFTLIELIVTVVILAILAALAVPAFRAVQDRSRDAALETELEALGRGVAALAAFDQTLTVATLTESLADEAQQAADGARASLRWDVVDDAPAAGTEPTDGVLYAKADEGGYLGAATTVPHDAGKVAYLIVSSSGGHAQLVSTSDTRPVTGVAALCFYGHGDGCPTEGADPEADTTPIGSGYGGTTTTSPDGSNSSDPQPEPVAEEPAPAPTALGAPTDVTAVASTTAAAIEVSFTPATSGATATSFTTTCTPTAGGTALSATSAASPVTVTSLAYSTEYTCAVTAANDTETSDPSAPSAPVTTASDPTALGAPTGVTAVASATVGALEVSFTPATSGATATSFTTTCTPTAGGTARSVTSAASPVTVTSLTNDTEYTCTVTAANDTDVSDPSEPSAPVTTRSAPTTIADYFSRPDSFELGSTSTGNIPWSVGPGGLKIVTQQAKGRTSGDNVAVVDTGESDGTVQLWQNGQSNFKGVVFRYVNSNNYWRYRMSNSTWVLQVVTNGGVANVASGPVPTGTGSMRVELDGHSIQIYDRNELKHSRTDSRHAHGTRHGMYASGTYPAVDNFYFKGR